MAGIYIHIPFCKKACHYCDFHFSTSTKSMPEMTAAILREINLQKEYLTEPVHTLYFGGGTPSLLSHHDLENIIRRIKETFEMAATAEITLEANPDDITIEKALNWKRVGINRLSIGIQSFFEEDLRWMNRAHHGTQAVNCIQWVQEAGFDNITIDLIYGTPSLTDERWKYNVDMAISCNIPHLSCYALTVEPNTALAKMISTHQSDNIDTDKQARHFSLLTKWVAQGGFEQYEISNFAKPGFRSKHNSAYWQGKPYLGIGPSAHSFNGNSRQWNIANNALYIKGIESGTVPFELEILTPTQQLNEYIMTGLRTIEGISLEKVNTGWENGFGEKLTGAAKKYLEEGYIKIENNHIALTDAGRFLADGIASGLFII